jgi:hypothetical protein
MSLAAIASRLHLIVMKTQLQHEIEWLDCKMNEVRKQMERRPSKVRHYMDLNRQKKEAMEKMKYLSIHNAR